MGVSHFACTASLLKHVHSHGDQNLSKQVLLEQLENDWPGQSKDAVKIMDELGITGVFDSEVSKISFKRIVKRACRATSDQALKDEIKTYKKMKALKDEITKGNSYFFTESLQNVRMLFRFRMELIEAKSNFKQKPDYKAEKYLCDSCESEIDENTHVLFCRSYQSLREGKNLNSDSDLCDYRRTVLSIRSELRLNR